MSKNQKQPNPWAIPPWPDQGDKDIQQTYAAMGKALSRWETFEGVLSILFAAFVGNHESNAARRAYNSVRTFQGRAEMLKAASEAYFSETTQDKHHEMVLNLFKDVLRSAKQAAEIRNDIAHGVIGEYRYFKSPKPPDLQVGYCLYPSFASFSDRDLKNIPAYCFASLELLDFSDKFAALEQPASNLAGHLLIRANNLSLRGKSP